MPAVPRNAFYITFSEDEYLELSPERAERIASYLRDTFIDRTVTRDWGPTNEGGYVAHRLPSIDDTVAGGPSLDTDLSQESERDNNDERPGPPSRS
jgi:hypothetical protein